MLEHKVATCCTVVQMGSTELRTDQKIQFPKRKLQTLSLCHSESSKSAIVANADDPKDIARAGRGHRLRDEAAAAARGSAAEALTARSGAPRPATKYRISCKREVA